MLTTIIILLFLIAFSIYTNYINEKIVKIQSDTIRIRDNTIKTLKDMLGDYKEREKQYEYVIRSLETKDKGKYWLSDRFSNN